MRILLVTTSLPHRMKNGAETATMNIVGALNADGHQCDVLGYARPGDGDPIPAHFHSAGPWPIEVENAGGRAYAWMLKALLTGEPFITTKFKSRPMAGLLRRLTATNHYDLVIINHAHMGWVLDETTLPSCRIVVAHNVEWKLYAEMGADPQANILKRFVYAREGRLVRALESALVTGSAQTWVLTQSDANGVMALGARTAPIVLDIPGQEFPRLNRPTDPHVDVGILGNWAWDVNRKGLQWFMDEVVPLLPSDLSVVVAGSRADLVPNRFPNVSYPGFVSDAGAFLRDCRVLAVPTQVGGGIQIKTIEGISAGVPMVSTPLGLRGIAEPPAFVHIEQDAARFAARLTELSRRPGPIDTADGARWAADRHQSFRTTLRVALDRLVPPPVLEQA